MKNQMTPDLGVNHTNQTTVRVPFYCFLGLKTNSWPRTPYLSPYLSFSSNGLHPTTDPQNVEPINGPPYDENI